MLGWPQPVTLAWKFRNLSSNLITKRLNDLSFRRINSHGSTDKSGDCSASSIRNQAATTEIRPAVRDRGLFLITISTS